MESSLRMRLVQEPIVPIVASLIRENPGTLSLGQGVAWYGPPPAAFERAQIEMRLPDNQLYAPVEGIEELRQAVAEKLAQDNGICLEDGKQIVVTAGANMGFLNAIMAITSPGDEVILLAPYYFNHEMTIRMLDCSAVIVDTDDRYHPCIDALKAAINTRTRAIVSISPNNPTGAVYRREELLAINELCRQHGIYHICDEAYEYFTYDDHRHFSVASLATATPHTISLFSLSKSYGFAGWRIGYMVIPGQLFDAVRKVQDSNLICAPVVSQYAALGAIGSGHHYCKLRQEIIRQNREHALSTAQQLDCISGGVHAEGAFYLLLKIGAAEDSHDLCRRLIREHAVAVIPGGAFGVKDECAIRISYGALAPDTFELAMGRLAKGLNAIVKH